jgi:TolA-binding protein
MMLFKILLLLGMTFVTLFAFGNDMAKQNRQKILSLQRIIVEQNERIDGLTSLIEGLNAQIAELKIIRTHTSKDREDNETIKLIEDLGKMIDEVSNNCVRRSELEKMVGSSTLPSVSKKTVAAPKKREGTLSNIPAKRLYSEGVRLYVKKRYEEAKRRFLLTAKKGYKPAASNYYLGEIAYYTKQYKDAIFYYKKSASLYDQASYMDVLLLHTAISLDKSGEKEQARLFYENVIENYPGKRSAEIAKKRLKGV